MAITVNTEYIDMLNKNQQDVRNLVMAGLQQIAEEKTKDFNSVCDRLEKKYKSEAISD